MSPTTSETRPVDSRAAPIEAWLRCGPGRARETVVAGRVLVEGGELTLPGVGDVLARHRAAAARVQGL